MSIQDDKMPYFKLFDSTHYVRGDTQKGSLTHMQRDMDIAVIFMLASHL